MVLKSYATFHTYLLHLFHTGWPSMFLVANMFGILEYEDSLGIRMGITGNTRSLNGITIFILSFDDNIWTTIF